MGQKRDNGKWDKYGLRKYAKNIKIIANLIKILYYENSKKNFKKIISGYPDHGKVKGKM